MEQLHAPEGKKRCREADVEESPSKRHHAEEGQRLPPANRARTILVNKRSTLKIPEYKMRYSKVVTMSQRQLYMRVYEQVSKQYCALHARINGTETCSDLQSSPKMKVHEDTQADMNLPGHNLDQTKLRRRLLYCQNKLGHIRKLCVEFDQWWMKQLLIKDKRKQQRNNRGFV
ncbi:RNA polymerase II elongation factor ELL3-like [Trichomycterus rosablanca]|uniref:RNA polymerase II elongation factor ELL3-like n=1 Tax=Trichomycterus rosablanca TaxID=2290929 RepID=UPI002F34F76A